MSKTENSREHAAARSIAKEAEKLGGRAYFVGGYVRDILLNRENKDIDIEVHGVSPKQLEDILDKVGQRISMGESFGVYGLKGYTLDIAMPRKETLRGRGHKDFDIFVDPFIGTFKAAQRRDFTVNSLMQDVLTGEIVDHFGGKNDLENGIIRHVNDETFTEDPLRVLRGAQFAARFGFTVADETVRLCKAVDLKHLPRERIEAELKKTLLKAERPSVFFEVLREMDQLGVWFPELKDLIWLMQDPIHHMEGDVWTHTMMVLDEAVRYREDVQNPFGFMLSALVHDFGKVLCTENIDGRIHAYGHETLGLPLIRRFLRRITGENRLIEYILSLAEHHMKPNIVAAAGSSVKATNKMFDKVIDPAALVFLALADSRGKRSPMPCAIHEEFLSSRLSIYNEYMSRPYVTGKDLIDAGLVPSERFSEVLSYAHKLRLAGVEKDSALKQTLSYAKKLKM